MRLTLPLLVPVTLSATLFVAGCDSAPGAAGAGAAPSGGAGGASGGAGGASGGAGGASGGAGQGGGATGGQGGGALASPGCGLAAAPGVTELSLEVEGSTRTALVSVPDGYDPSTPLPLVFAWHGLGGSGALARAYFGVEQASGGAAIFVYPDGLPTPQGGTGWELEGDGRDVALFDALLAELEATLCVDGARVFSTGHSFGGYFSNTLGCARSSELRAIAPVAGGGPFDAACDPAPLAVWLAHAPNDDVVPFSQGEASLEHWAEHAACAATSTPSAPDGCVARDGCAGGPVVFCSHDEGHDWPGLAPASIWAFFAAQ